ncbi:PRC-barrel domain-containing protein [Dietzia sp. CH92]|uniref:PRC-barrel domain-containing protein n=1 Tax=Dietzia sp. CH92 TaxID=3051823 RepID=UPI0028D4EF30|nr:PRC-barrel domain-containing protein [Dietzia sp. CH92]
MNLKEQLDALLDATAFDSTGAKIGAVRQVFVDDASGKITFATVSTGLFSADAIVPLHGARLLDDELHVDHTRAVIRDSPRPDDTEDGLTPEQEAKLLEYYGIETPARLRGTAAQDPAPSPSPRAPQDGGPQPSAPKDAGPRKPGPAGATRTPSAAPKDATRAAAGETPGKDDEDDRGGDGGAPTSGAAAQASAAAAQAARGDGKGATTTTKSTDGDTAADSPAPAKSSGPGPATPAAGPSDEAGGKDPAPRRD